MVSNDRGSGRSRLIIAVGLIVILLAGGWVIARRISPYVNEVLSAQKEDGVFSVPSSVAGTSLSGDALSLSKTSARETGGIRAASTEGVGAVSSPAPSVAKATVEQVNERKIIKTGNLRLSVADADEAAGDIAEKVARLGGEVHSSYFSLSADGLKRGWMRLKVPAEKFDEALRLVKETAVTVRSEETTGRDVGEKFVDLRSRLNNKRREEESIARILEKSGEISEVLAVTRELSRVRGEIERLEGKLRYLASQTEQADIYVHLEEERKISGKKDWRPGAVLRKAVDNLLVNVQKTIDAGIAFAVGFIPLFFLYVLGIFILWRLFRRGYRFWRERLRKER